jgi:protein O-mannosyl-transferase
MSADHRKRQKIKQRQPAPKAAAAAPPLTQSSGRNKARNILLAAIIITAIVYLPSLFNDFIVNWDDGGYIHEHELIHRLSADNVITIFNPTTFYKGNYHPLTTFFYALEYALVGESPFLYHLNNLIFHLLNVFLVFVFIRMISQKPWLAGLTAVLFGVHPMHVESVAWISERKDVLYTFFFLLSLIAYLKYFTRRENSRKQYIFALLFFFLSLLSKSAATILPVVMLVLDYYMKRKFTLKLLAEKIPFFLLSFLFGRLAVLSQGEKGAIQDLAPLFGWGERILIVCHTYLTYLIKIFLPFKLSVMYPYPDRIEGQLPLLYMLAPIGILLLGVLLFIARKKGRDYFFGFLFFTVNLLLVIQLVPVGGAVLSERYTYVPYIGIFFILGKWYESGLKTKLPRFRQARTFAHLLAAAFVLFCSLLSVQRIQDWKNGEVLFTDLIRKYPYMPFGYNNRGYMYYHWHKNYPKALQDLNMAVAIDSNYYQALSNRGVVLFNMGEYEKSIRDFSRALILNPENRDSRIGRANAYSTLLNFEAALPDYNIYLTQKPDHAKAWQWRATAYFNTGKYDAAYNDIMHCLAMTPADDEAWYWKGLILFRMEKFEESLEAFNKSEAMNPSRAELYSWRGLLKYNMKQYPASIADYTRAIEINANDAAAYVNRSVSLYETGDYRRAWDDINKAGQMGYPLDKNFFMKLQAAVAANP